MKNRNPWRRFTAPFVIAVAAGTIMCSCSSDSASEATPLARVDDEILTLEQLRADMPRGLSGEDSVKFVKTYIDNWIDTRLITSIAADVVDMKEIDRLCDEYRNELIVSFYRRYMLDNGALPRLSEDSLKTYYEQHKSEFKLRYPMVRGIYLKLPSDADNVQTLRRIFKSERQDDMDRLEKEAFNSAIHYDAFRDNWIDWEQIETKIPYDFGSRPELWPVPGRSLDFSSGGSTYLLLISDCRAAGMPMPFEVAAPIIRERLLVERRRRLDMEMMHEMREHAAKEGMLEVFG